MSATRFDDLPLVTDEDEMRRVHRTPGLYFITRGGKAHDDMTCNHVRSSAGGRVIRVSTRVSNGVDARRRR